MKLNSPNDFSKPQRQSIKGIAIMFADTAQELIRSLWVPLALIIYKIEGSNMIWIVIGLLFLFSLISLVAYLKYINFTFYLDEEKQEFVIQKGVITKNKITIQLDKIQQVNINQSVIQKLVGVFSVDIDTAGSNKKEVSIRAVDNDLALLLKHKLLSYERVELEEKEITEEATLPFLKIRFSTLFKVGITSKYGRSIALILGFMGSLYGGFQDVKQSIEVDEEQVSGWVENGMSYFSWSFFLLFILAIVLSINLIRTVVKYFDYQMTLQKGAIAIQHGLFAKKNTLLKPQKVQIVILSQNYFQRKLKLFDIQLKQASATDEVEQEGKKSGEIEVPGCQPDEKERLLEQLKMSTKQAFETIVPNYRYLFKAISLSIILPCLIFLLLAFTVYSPLKDIIPIVFIYIILVGIVVFFRFKNYRMLLNKELIMVKQNAWDVKYQLIEPYKIQGVTTQQYFWHQSADLVHLTLHTAAGDLSFRFVNYSQLKPWLNYWLYTAEGSQRNWM